MGEERVKLAENREDIQRFMKLVLKDIQALDKMLQGDWFETNPIRIGAEQELCLVDEHVKAAPWGMEVLEKLGAEKAQQFTTELAKFNIEINLTPQKFTGNCLERMEAELLRNVDVLRDVVEEMGGDILFTGILPTIRKSDIDMKNLTPLQRYRALCKAISKMRGEQFNLRIQGMDELLMKFDSPLLEACNTGFQIHLQVTPADFVRKYNIAQAITGPVLAAAVGSPFLFGKRLWAETRIALFQQSVDTRTAGDHLRESSPRVTFGNEWLKDSILEIFQEDTARYRIMLASSIEEDVEDLLEKGIPPQLNALKVHNGTVYRWNRPCYGVANGKAHLRIENRVLPSGPTVTDEMANTAFWLGLLNKLEDYYFDIRKVMEFDNARHNFVAASKMGLDTTFRWVNGERMNAVDLINEELLPIAREGLEKAAINPHDIDHYLGIIHQRVEKGQTASTWMINNYGTLLSEENPKEQALAAITTAMIKNQKKGEPVHQWGRVRIEDLEHWQPASLLVEEFMATDLFTVQRTDILEFVANLVDWRKIRYVPVEDEDSRLIGLVTMRGLFRQYSKKINQNEKLSETVEEIMIENPITIHPEASIIEAMDIMNSQKIGCLPVVKNNRLVGIITEHNYIRIATHLIRVLHLNKKNAASSAEEE